MADPLAGNPNLAQQAPLPQNAPAPENISAPINTPDQPLAPAPQVAQGKAQWVLSNAQNAQQSPNAPQPQAETIDPRLIKTGLGWHALMGTHGEVGPNGTVTQAPNNAGQLFRSILSGAIMGMAAGSQAKMGGGIGSFAVGAGAEQQHQEQEKDKLQQQSQQQYQNQQEKEKADQQSQLIHAQMANMQSETAVRQHTVDLEDKKYHDLHNAASQALVDGLTAAGGVDPVDGKLSSTMSVPDLVKAYTKDPSVRQAPTGYFRHFIDTTDSSELTYNGDHWVHADGTPANLTDSSSVRILDVPANAMTTKKPASGADLNKIAGQQLFDPSKTYQVSPVDMDAMNTTRLKNENEAARTRQADRQIKAAERSNQLEADRQRHAEFDAQRVALGAKKESLASQLKAMDNDLSATPADKQALAAQIAQQDQAIQDLADQEYPRTGKGKVAEKPEAPKAAPNQKVLSALQGVPGVSPAAASAVAAMKPEDIQAYLPTAKLPDNVKTALYEAIGVLPPSPKRFFDSVPKGSPAEKALNMPPQVFNPGGII